jgi:hypothetical protein
MNSSITELKTRIKEGQRRLRVLEQDMDKGQGEDLAKYREAYGRILAKTKALCSQLQELLGRENTCPWGCWACLNWEESPLEVFEERGFLLLWSDVLNDAVAFAKEWARDKVPRGYVVYLESELVKLFSGNPVLKPKTLQVIHAAKKRGGIVKDIENDEKQPEIGCQQRLQI